MFYAKSLHLKHFSAIAHVLKIKSGHRHKIKHKTFAQYFKQVI